MLSVLPVFIVTALMFAMLPGPDFALIVRTALIYGKRHALFSSLGIAAGFSVHTTLGVLGLSAIIAHSPLLFNLVTWAGAAYLAWLGIQALRARPGKPDKTASSEEQGRMGTEKPSFSPAKAFRQGFLTNILNPKVILYFLTFFPQFVVHDAEMSVTAQLFVLGVSCCLVQLFVLGVSCCLVTGGWFIFLSLMLSRVRRYFESETFRRWLERITGVIFLGFSVKLLASSS